MRQLVLLLFILVVMDRASSQVSVSGASCTTTGIQTAIRSVASSGGGTVSVYCPGTHNITANLWSGITVPTEVIFGPGTFSSTVQQILPDNTEVSGSGRGTIFQIASTDSFNTPFNNGLFTNLLNNGGHSSSTNVGISLHDFEIDGTPNIGNSAGVSFYNIEHSSIYDLYIHNTYQAGVDLRNASDVNVHDNWCIDCAIQGYPQHAIGGGVNAASDVFLYNKFPRHHVSGGGGSSEIGADQYEVFGQGTAGNVRCGFNIVTDNTSDSAPTVGIYLDTCNHNTVTGNIIRNAGTAAIACTSGTFNLDGGCDFNSFSNQVESSGAQGYLLSNAHDNVIAGSTIHATGQEAILLVDSIRSKVDGIDVYSPSQSSANTYCAVTITSGASTTYSDDNTIQNNTLNDKNIFGVFENKMKTGVCITKSGSALATNITNNLVEHNRISGGSAGSYGDGVSDAGSHNRVFCNAYGDDGSTFGCGLEHQ